MNIRQTSSWSPNLSKINCCLHYIFSLNNVHNFDRYFHVNLKEGNSQMDWGGQVNLYAQLLFYSLYWIKYSANKFDFHELSICWRRLNNTRVWWMFKTQRVKNILYSVNDKFVPNQCFLNFIWALLLHNSYVIIARTGHRRIKYGFCC